MARKASVTMKARTAFRTGVVGSVVFAACCFSPILVVLFGAVGLTAWLGWFDFVLLPALGIFLGLTAYGLVTRQRSTGR